MNQIYKKEFNFSEILSFSWNIFKNNYLLILLVMLIVYVPVYAIQNFALFDVFNSQEVNEFNLSALIIGLLLSFIQLLAVMAAFYVIKKRIDNKKVNAEEAFRAAFNKWPMAIWTNIILVVLLILLFALLIIPGIIFSVYWMFVLLVVVFNEKSGMAALKYSKSIVQNRWWKVFGYSLVFGIMLSVIVLILSLPFTLSLGAEVFAASKFANFSFNIITVIVSAFFTVITTVFYLNLESNPVKKKKK